MKLRLLLIIFAGLLAVQIISGGNGLFAASDNGKEDSAYANISIFTRALQLIRQDYVDNSHISYRELIYGALKGMLAELDPHSQFMEPKEFRSMQDDTKGDFGGLGIVVAMKDGVLTIVSPMEDTPGFKAGLLPGDQILKINGVSTEKLDLSQAVTRLRGEPGEKVTLTILRPSTRLIQDYVLERAVIKVRSVKGQKILPKDQGGDWKIGYLRVVQFTEPTAKELSQALDTLEHEGMQALILDLRYNPGGLLSSAVDVCAQFLPPRQMVVSTEGRSASQQRVYRTPSDTKQRPRIPMVVLVNGGSASASEIVAGALKDLNRAVIVGETTFGKGSVQSVIQLPDGSALRLTTAKYYTPSKVSIHERGVAPNIRVALTSNQERDLLMLRRDEVVVTAKPEELAKLRDVQLERAAEILQGMLVYKSRVAEEKTVSAR